MVTFGLFGKRSNTSSNPMANTSRNILDELMGFDNTTHNKDYDKYEYNTNTSSFNLDDIFNKLPNKSNVDYKEVLLMSLHAQVDYLRQDSLRKTEIIQSLANNYVALTNNYVENTKIATTEDMCNDNVDSTECRTSNLSPALNKSCSGYSNISSHISDTEEATPFSVDEQLKEVRQLKSYDFHHNAPTNDDLIAPWEKYSLGFGSKMLNKMGYRGGGLGKDGSGILNPIVVNMKCGRGIIGNNEAEVKQHVPYINRGLEGLLTESVITRKRVVNEIHPWPPNTTLITGSSILSGIEENRLGKYNVKIRAFPGACVDDMYDYLLPLLKKKPTYMILHIGSNDSHRKTADEIATEIKNLKLFIEDMLPTVKIFLSCPVLRTDNLQANVTLRKLDKILKGMPNIISNDNIDKTCLGKKGLHLNPKGSDRLVINYISLMRRL